MQEKGVKIMPRPYLGDPKFKRNVSKKRIDRDGYIVLYEKDFTK